MCVINNYEYEELTTMKLSVVGYGSSLHVRVPSPHKVMDLLGFPGKLLSMPIVAACCCYPSSLSRGSKHLSQTCFVAA